MRLVILCRTCHNVTAQIIAVRAAGKGFPAMLSYDEFEEIFNLLTPEQQADILAAMRLFAENNENPPLVIDADDRKDD